MKDKNELPQDSEENYNNIHLYIAVISCVLAGVFYGLIFSPIGVHSLIVATLFSLVALNFIAKHKKYKNDGVCKTVTVCAYVLFGLCLLTFIGGMITAALQG